MKETQKGVDTVCKVMEELREQSIARGEERALLASIKNLMKNMKWSAEQAMTALGIAENDQAKYAAQL
ncbi:MAG: hypothetical protein IIY45_15180 [Firmicutes bacterium]|nr:hypothetical protein [Bacillota bacterium]